MKRSNAIVIVSLLFVLIHSVFSARILGAVPTPAYSHQVAFHSLWKELSLRGHQVTVLTTNPIKNPSLTNLTEIDLSDIYKKWQQINKNEMSHLGFLGIFQVMKLFGNKIIDEELQNPKVTELINDKNKTFDVLLVEPCFPGMVAFAEIYNCPLIQIFPVDGLTANYYMMGSPSHPILNPESMLPFSGKLSFFERLISTFYTIGAVLNNKFIFFPSQDELIKKYFGDGLPPVEEILLRRSSLMLVNTDLIFHPVRPLLPNVIQFGGGTHMTPPKPLPKDLKKILDDANNGVIYFSLGSNVKSSLLLENVKKVFMEVFAELPYTVLWKFEEEDLPGKPENVFISKWFPQQDVFRHPNVKLFISQGGLQSIEEAVHNHIPIIGVPFIGDQDQNVRRLEKQGMGLHLDKSTINKRSLKKAILEVINNQTYRDRVKELEELAKDQPMTGLERAIWWTEYVIRHKGAKHLRSPALDLPEYQYYLLDVISFCLLVVLIGIYLLIKLTKLIFTTVRYFLPKSKLKTQ